jgi:lipoate---protein ligase
MNPMRRLDLTLDTFAENLALDEALLEWAEAEDPQWEFVRVWESRQPLVVVGRSTRVQQEVDEAACRRRNIPILRRASGGASIVAGPGCLMYAVVLSYAQRPELRDIPRAHAFVLGRIAQQLTPLVADVGKVEHRGTSDLVLAESGGSAALKKFSGNSLRAKRTHFLYHGTLLYGFDVSLIGECLRTPPRQPEYREGRSHSDFVANLPVARQDLVRALDRAWPAADLESWPTDRVAKLAAERFSSDAWNYEFR